MDYIPDYTELHAMHEAEQERRLRRHPTCVQCKEKITDEEFYNFDGDYVCEHCLDYYVSEHFKVNTDDYMED